MKFVGIVAALFYFKSVHASLASLNKAQKLLVQQMGGNNRNLMDETVSSLNKYGCWCYFDADMIGNGRGLPKDFIDEECRDLHRAYTCAMAEIEGCEPYTVEYSPGNQAINRPGVDGDILKACEYTNRFFPMVDTINGVQVAHQACAIAACSSELKFLTNVNAYLLTEDADYPGLTHKGINYPAQAGVHPAGVGTFTPVGDDNGSPVMCPPECPKGICYSDYDPRGCCGKYPERYPFKIHNGKVALEKACCGEDWVSSANNNAFTDKDGNQISGTDTYQTATHQCVNNAVVAK